MPFETGMAIKPNMTYEEAVVSYGAIMALPLIKRQIHGRDKNLINGASGAIGSAAVQLAKHFGVEVTGVCGTDRNM
jgi:NADPH:quinone reductase-like Zn-dependent oxidoreductase